MSHNNETDGSELESLIPMGTTQSKQAEECASPPSTPSRPEKDASTASISDLAVPVEMIDARLASSTDTSLGEAVSPLVFSASGTQDSANPIINQYSIDYTLRDEEPPNQAFVFIKPHANTEKVRNFVRTRILENINPLSDNEGGRFVGECEISSDHIESAGLIDTHYKALAVNAMKIRGVDSKIPADMFKTMYGEDLQTVKIERRIYNAAEALSVFHCTPEDLEGAWREAEADVSRGRIKRFGSGFYCGYLTLNNKNVYIINGFYMAMRGKYVAKDASIHAYIIQWNESALTWKDFRSKVIGSTNPANAEKDSIRNTIFHRFQELGLTEQPDTGNNAIHASASPLEALAERCNWCSQAIQQDQFGTMLLGKGIPEASITEWCDNIAVRLPTKSETSGHKKDMVFDIVEDLSTHECIEKLVGVYDYELFADIPQRSRCSGKVCCVIS